MKRYATIFLLCIVFSCKDKKKNVGPVTEPPTPPPVVNPDTGLKCTALPKTPEPFGWTDSTVDVNRNVKAFIYNPINASEIIYVVYGDIFAYNRMYNMNVVTKQTVTLPPLGRFLPSVNKNGWITFSSIDNIVYKVKTNGDSLTQLTYGKFHEGAQWDLTGKSLYYFQQAISTVSASLYKVSAAGTLQTNIECDLPFFAPFRKTDQLIYCQLNDNNSSVTLVQRNMATQVERTLITGPYDSKTGTIHFNDLCVDNNDEFFYWSNEYGIFRCHLQSLKTDTLLKNCPNYQHSSPLMSYKGNDLNYTRHILKPLNASVMFHQYQAMEINLTTRKSAEVRIFK